MEWKDNHIEITPQKRPKKLTATRFATVLGLNPWSTEFEMFCAISKVYEKPYEDTIYTAAGKAIEPKQIAYMKKAYFMTNLKTPTDIYGKDYFKKTYGDFYKDEPIFGGMWDSLLYGPDGKIETVLEFKTTKRAEDWSGGNIPEYYALQAALYAYLLGVDNVIMVASFLEMGDYELPEDFVINSDNTITVPFKVSERYPNFERDYVKPAEKWWHDHIETGISPDFDESKDADILKELRKNSVAPDENLDTLLAEAEELQTEIDAHEAEIKEKTDRLKKLKERIKKSAVEQFRDGDKKVEIKGKTFIWTVSKEVRTGIDKDALVNDGLYEKYSKESITYKIQPKKIKEDK